MKRRWMQAYEGEDAREGGVAASRANGEAICRVCSVAFRCDATWFAHRGLRSPVRCPGCRAQRHRVPASRLVGTVVRVFDHFAFIDSQCGRRFYVSVPDAVRPADLPLVRGDEVTFEPDDLAPAGGNRRCPRAFVVRRA